MKIQQYKNILPLFIAVREKTLKALRVARRGGNVYGSATASDDVGTVVRALYPTRSLAPAQPRDKATSAIS
ncbi:unnamed protein product [Leptosia nina]|uniref:Uncharacterized protein n=1 Tax=Leptosia nina TaxID=320188 RepID=A0AAV1K239_9NEOP